MVAIKVLGSGCARCQKLEEIVREAVIELDVEATIQKVKEDAEIAKYPILSTPGLVINEELKSAGRIPKKDEVIKWLRGVMN
jgi:small redox-active disulfide protein 2